MGLEKLVEVSEIAKTEKDNFKEIKPQNGMTLEKAKDFVKSFFEDMKSLAESGEFKELLKDGSTSLIPQNLATNILNAKAKLSNLTKWAKKDEELTGTEGNYWYEFIDAFTSDFDESMGQTRSSMGLFVVYDPTRPQEAGYTFNGYDDEKYIEYRESGILGYAYYNREWISHD